MVAQRGQEGGLPCRGQWILRQLRLLLRLLLLLMLLMLLLLMLLHALCFSQLGLIRLAQAPCQFLALAC